jgi:hypothetical protein
MLGRVLPVFSVACLSAAAFLWNLAAAVPAGRAHEWLLAPAAVDLGTVDQGGKVEFSYPVKNTTSTPVTLLELQSSCGCTWIEMTPGQTLPPGETLTLRGELDVTHRRLALRVNAALRYRPQTERDERTAILEVNAFVRPLIRAVPEPLTLSLAGGDDDSSAAVELDSERLDSFTITGVETTEPWLRAAVERPRFESGDPHNSRAIVRVSLDREAFGKATSGPSRRPAYLRVFAFTDSVHAVEIPVQFQ